MPRIADIKSADGTPLALFRWEGTDTSKGHLLIVHGLAEHMGRYEEVGGWCADAGYRATGLELRGHGDSGGKRGHILSWSEYVADVDAAVKSLETDRLVVLAHSMGGLVVLDWLRNNADKAKAVALSAPLLQASVKAPRWKVMAANVLSRITPGLVMANEIPPSDVSRSPEIVKNYASDSRIFHGVTPRWYTEMNATQARVVEHAPSYRTPARFVWGTDDKIVSPEAIERFAGAYGGPGSQRSWKGLYHELLYEPEKEQVREDLFSWLAGVA
jgi:alpha-beta hydrolase superfamily lysophospholipase